MPLIQDRVGKMPMKQIADQLGHGPATTAVCHVDGPGAERDSLIHFVHATASSAFAGVRNRP